MRKSKRSFAATDPSIAGGRIGAWEEDLVEGLGVGVVVE
mgnify:CR=1 FL=1